MFNFFKKKTDFDKVAADIIQSNLFRPGMSTEERKEGEQVYRIMKKFSEFLDFVVEKEKVDMKVVISVLMPFFIGFAKGHLDADDYNRILKVSLGANETPPGIG